MPTCAFIPASVAEPALAPLDSYADGKQEPEPLKSVAAGAGVPARILIDKNVQGQVEIHRHEADLWIGIDGETFFEADGAAIEPWVKRKPSGINDKELKAKGIQGGTTYKIGAGDMLYIPAGVPHRHWAQSAGRLWIIKIPAKVEVPLSAFPDYKIIDIS